MANEFKLFAGPSTNTLSPAAWASLTSLLANGFGSGLANSQQANTLFRQLSTVAAGVGKFIDDQGFSALDNGDIGAFATAFASALSKAALPPGALIDFGVTGSIPGFIAADGSVPLISSVPDLASRIYCGDANNATAEWGYKCTNPASPSASRSTAGTYIVLLDARGRFRRSLANGGSLDGGRSLWAYQTHMFQNHQHGVPIRDEWTDGEVWDYNGSSSGGGAVGGRWRPKTSYSLNGDYGAETRPYNYASTTYFKL